MKRMVLSLMVIASLGMAKNDPPAKSQKQKIPSWVERLFVSKKLNEPYEFLFKISPSYLQGDFNGDKKPDIAVLIKEKNSGKNGIAIFHAGKNEVIILGAGKDFDGEDDISWIGSWSVWPKGHVPSNIENEPGPKLKGDALYLAKDEDGLGIAYWDGKQYRFYSMGC